MILQIIIAILLTIISIILIWTYSYYPFIEFWKWINQYSAILAVFATIALGVIAIFGERIRLKLFGAKLKILFDQNKMTLPYIKSARIQIISLIDDPEIAGQIQDRLHFINIESIWVRVIVDNDGNTTARNCEPRLEKITKNGKLIKEFDPITLHWVGQPPKIETRKDAYLDIKPNSKELLDVCYFSKKDSEDLTSYRIGSIKEVDLKSVKIYDPNPVNRANRVELSKDNEICFSIKIVSENNIAKRSIVIKPTDILTNSGSPDS